MRYHIDMVRALSVRGMTLVDVLVGVSLMLVIFLALIGLLRASLLVASLAKAKAGATAVVDNQMEYIRALPYDSVGTVGGIPSGVIPEFSTTTENTIPYAVRTFIEYVDDPADGTGGADTNGITTDYKRVKVAVTYFLKGKLREVDMVSNYAPVSIETTTNGGTLKVNVVSSTGTPVSGASVRVVNASTTPTVDVVTYSDSTGVVLLGGAATSTQYQIYVSKPGYSSAQTYARDSNNQNPSPGYLTVVKNQTTSSTFAIDVVSSFALSTYYPVSATSTLDTFVDASKLATQTNTQVSAGSLMLAGGGVPGYATNGNAKSVNVTPVRLVSWTSASTTIATPAGTTALVHVLDGSGALIPDGVIPGNSTGLSGTSINLSGVSTSTYPTLALSIDLATSATSTTPSLSDWSLNSRTGPTPIANVSIGLTGAKTVGTTGGGSPIYKTVIATTTGATGINTLFLEWDSYVLTLNGYDTVDACNAPPYSVPAGVTQSHALYLGTATTNSLLVSVRDNTGAYVPGASVTLSKSGYSSTVTTSACGTAYFGALSSSSSYSVQIVKTGYTTTSFSNIDVTGHVFYGPSFP